MRLPGLSVIEAPRSVLGGGVPLMSTRVTPAVCTAEREQKCRPHFVVTFCRRGPCVSVAESDYSASAETRKPIYRIRRCCNTTSEYSLMRSIGLTLLLNDY